MKKKIEPIVVIALCVFSPMIICFCISLFLSLSSQNKDEPEVTITPLDLQIPGWEDESVNTMCLEVSQEYPEEWFGFFKETLVKLGMDISPREYSFPFHSVVSEIMEEIGIQVVEEDAQCDASLSIEITGEGRSSTYGDIITRLGKNRCYTGSYVKGVLELSTENEETYKTAFSGQVPRPETITSGNCPDQPYEAPFLESSAEAITKALVKLWGPEIGKVIRQRYSGYGEIDNAMFRAAKKSMDGQLDNAPTMPPAEPTTEPFPP